MKINKSQNFPGLSRTLFKFQDFEGLFRTPGPAGTLKVQLFLEHRLKVFLQ